MLTQPLFGYINERFGIVKITTLSLGVPHGRSGCVLSGPLTSFVDDLLWLGITVSKWDGSHGWRFLATQSPYAFGKMRVWGGR